MVILRDDPVMNGESKKTELGVGISISEHSGSVWLSESVQQGDTFDLFLYCRSDAC